jgi:drug/metabolite transporter (DMT)-like permease
MKILARSSFLLVTVLWGSFYAVAKAALTHVDPIIFTFFEAMALVPIALTLLLMQRHTLNRTALKRGILLGSCLCIATLTITVSEKFTNATSTAFFPSTGAVFAAVITATVFGRSLGKSIWTACLLSLLGVFLILRTSLSGLQFRGDIIALLGALLFTVYLFLVDQDAQQERKQFWAIVGVEHLCFALWMILFSLLFGDWQHFHPVLSQDIPIVLYVALVCTFLPVILTHFAHRYIDPLETGFISILEPLWGVLIAHLWLGEAVPLSMSVGGGLIISGTFLHLIGAGDLPHFFHRVMRLLQKQRRSAGMALHHVRSLRLAPYLVMCLIQTWVSRCLSVFHVSVKYLHGSWEERRIRSGDFVWIWFAKRFFSERPSHESLSRVSFGHIIPLFCVNARNTLFDTPSALFSIWHVLHLNGSTFLPFLACSQERRWQRPSQYFVPP